MSNQHFPVTVSSLRYLHGAAAYYDYRRVPGNGGFGDVYEYGIRINLVDESHGQVKTENMDSCKKQHQLWEGGWWQLNKLGENDLKRVKEAAEKTAEKADGKWDKCRGTNWLKDLVKKVIARND